MPEQAVDLAGIPLPAALLGMGTLLAVFALLALAVLALRKAAPHLTGRRGETAPFPSHGSAPQATTGQAFASGAPVASGASLSEAPPPPPEVAVAIGLALHLEGAGSKTTGEVAAAIAAALHLDGRAFGFAAAVPTAPQGPWAAAGRSDAHRGRLSLQNRLGRF